jgi:antitoxin component YwqK of YwqJK toxin-antitoxin module
LVYEVILPLYEINKINILNNTYFYLLLFAFRIEISFSIILDYKILTIVKMKKRILIIIIICVASFKVSSQKINKDYYPYSNKVKFEYQIDNKSGAKNGYFKSFFSNGLIYQKGNFKFGKQHGEWLTYDESGSGNILSIENYNIGYKNGLQKQYCIEKLKKYLCGQFEYKNDTLILETTFYSNGKKHIENKYFPKPGYRNLWFEDGTAEIETKLGKTYIFEEETKNNINLGKYVRKIEFDSIDHHFIYNYKTKIDYKYDEIKRSSYPILEFVYLNEIIVENVYNGQKIGYEFINLGLEEIKNLLNEYSLKEIFEYNPKLIEEFKKIPFYNPNKTSKLKVCYNYSSQRGEKINDSIKVVANKLIEKNPLINETKILLPEKTLNSLAYKYLNENLLEDSLTIFKKNIELYPESWNAWDSYGEGLAKSGRKNEAIEAYIKSIKLNPNNIDGIEKLKLLQEDIKQ